MSFTRRTFFLPLVVSTASLLLLKDIKVETKQPINLVKFDKKGVYRQFLQKGTGKLSCLSRRRRNNPDYLLQTGDRLFDNYPDLGNLPSINESGLDFLHETIEEACICVSQGQFSTRWFGRNSLSNQEFWSATKLIPLLNVVSRANLAAPEVNIADCQVRGLNQNQELVSVNFGELAEDIMTYRQKIASSNALAATLKRFQPQLELETWFQELTGNRDLVFRGRYGEPPLIDSPELYYPARERVILQEDSQPDQWGDNLVSAYDLTRLMTLIGWYHHLPPRARLPGLNQSSWDCLIRVMGLDTVCFADLALEMLDLSDRTEAVVILSKQGHGVTKIRNRTERVYVALVQLITEGELVTLAMTLRGAIALQPRDFHQELTLLDARLATEVTEIIWRVLAQEL